MRIGYRRDVHDWLRHGVLAALATGMIAADAPESRLAEPAKLRLTPAAEVVAELERAGTFQRTKPFYAAQKLGPSYDGAMSVVSRPDHYLKMSAGDRYLDPATEAHESLHGTSSLIRRTRHRSLDDGYDAVFVTNGGFAEVQTRPGIAKSKIAAWLPEGARSSPVAMMHTADPAFRDAPVVLVVEELAYHLLDAQIGLENHDYFQRKLKLSTASAVPGAEWAVVALATATMLDADPKAFADASDRDQFNLLVGDLVTSAVELYAKAMDAGTYGLIGNVAPESRSLFAYLATEKSPQADKIRSFCGRTYGKTWLPDLADRVALARESEPSDPRPGEGR